jgi:hypothetical protein
MTQTGEGMGSERGAAVSEAATGGGTAAVAQYLVVECNVTRVVTVDGKAVGRTDEVLELPAGEHTVSLLTPPANVRPKARRVRLDGTSREKPLIVRFETR